MSPRITKDMMKKAQKDGAEISEKRKVQKPKPQQATPKPEAKPQVPDRSAEIEALRDEISVLRAELDSQRKASQKSTQELLTMLAGMGDTKPMRVKPIRDMDPNSKQYLLVQYYDFVPVEYRKLDS